MRKIILTLVIALFTIGLNAQTRLPYKNLQVNKPVKYMNFNMPSCYIVINDLNIQSFNMLKANVQIAIYETKEISIANPTYFTYPVQIPYPMNVPIGTFFTEGDIFDKISQAVKDEILRVNPTWVGGDIIIE